MIPFIYYPKPGKLLCSVNRDSGSWEGGLSGCFVLFLIWLLVTWATQFVETLSSVHVFLKNKTKCNKCHHKAHILKCVWGCPSFPTEANSQGPASPVGGSRACLAFPAPSPPLSFCLPDIAGSSEMWEKLEKDILDHLTSEVLEDYGQDYILAQRNFVELVDRHSNPDVCPVLLDVWHAISAKSPFTFYTPGSGTYLWLCFVSFSPTGIFDYVSKKLHNFQSSMPRALSTPNLKNKGT